MIHYNRQSGRGKGVSERRCCFKGGKQGHCRWPEIGGYKTKSGSIPTAVMTGGWNDDEMREHGFPTPSRMSDVVA
jgi:hypothetical protein